ncbi:MAG: dipeptidyl-peptidase 3 family protein [Thermoanaerobaculia bacterium]
MKRRISLLFIALCISIVASACKSEKSADPTTTAPAAAVQGPEIVKDLDARLAQLPRTTIDYDRSLLDETETKVLEKLVEASRIIDDIYWIQVAEENTRVKAELETAATASPEHAKALALFTMNHGRWDRLSEDEPFVAPFGDAGKKPHGAGFYPTDMTKEEFEAWIAANPKDKEAFQSTFTVIQRDGKGLKAVPYSEAYKAKLEEAAAKLREAAAMTKNASLKSFLEKRAAAFLSNDYYESDFAWMDLDSPIEIVIGPYEVYEDGHFNYKAAFEAFVCVVDKGESDKLKIYEKHLPAMERALPIPDEHKNPNRGGESPIKVVQEVFTSGDARNGVQTSAFNLPNDERVREAKGSKKVMLKNVMEAKFKQSGQPIAMRTLDPSQTSLINFDAYFNFVLFHELSHGLGPGIINGPDGKRIEARLLLKELYSSIEECKADVLGVWAVQYAMEKGLITEFNRDQLHATTAGMAFRSIRFGIDEAHGRGTAVQWNYYRERDAIVPGANGTFRVDMDKMDAALKSLATELLMIEATGDYARAKAFLDTYGVRNAEIDAVTKTLEDIPVDITPVFVAVGEK